MAVTTPAPRVFADLLPRSAVRDVLLVVAGAAFVGLAAQIAVPLPFTPVPLTMQTFAVLLVGASLGTIRGMLSMLLYALAGMAGLPWFAEFTSGFAMPSFGYIIGFILAAGLVGYLAERGWTRTVVDTALAMVLGSVVIYAVGVTWLKFSVAGTTWAGAIAMGMSPFLLGDAVKVMLAAGLFPLVWKGLTKLGVAPRETDGTEPRVVETHGDEPSLETELPADELAADELAADEGVIDLTDDLLGRPDSVPSADSTERD